MENTKLTDKEYRMLVLENLNTAYQYIINVNVFNMDITTVRKLDKALHGINKLNTNK